MDNIIRYFTDLSDLQHNQLAALGALYKEWNNKINVISRKDIDNLYDHHVLHSLAIAKYFSFNKGQLVLDAGTGGGFPGLPLAIINPQVHFILLDATAKKLKVVNAICNSIGLKNITTLHNRLEAVTEKYDYVLSRAVTRLDTMWPLVKPLLNNKHGGLIYLKGGDFSSEVPNNVNCRIINIIELYSDLVYYEDKKIVYMQI